MFEGGRYTVSVVIYFRFINFVAIGITRSRHHISVSSVMTELLMSQPNFLINCLNQSIPCCDNPFSSLIKQCCDTYFYCHNQEFVSPNCCNLKLPSNPVNHPQLNQNFQFKQCEELMKWHLLLHILDEVAPPSLTFQSEPHEGNAILG